MNTFIPVNFNTVLEQLDQLLDDTPSDIIEQSDRLVHTVYAKLQKYRRKSVLSLLDTIEKSQGKIEKYTTQNTAQQAVRSEVDWTKVDLRVHDMQLGDKKQNDKTKFRKGLAERSLALEFHNWEMKEFGESKLSKLVEDITSFKDKMDGNIQKFMAYSGIPAIDCVNRGIQHGTKLLFVERLLGSPSVSVILFFAFGKFRNTVYPELPQLVDLMKGHAWTARFTADIEDWFSDCCGYYSREVGSRKRKRDVSTINEHVRLDKRIRGETQTLGQAVDHTDERDAIMLPRQSAASNCDSTLGAQTDSDGTDDRQISNRYGSSTAPYIPATSHTASAGPESNSLHTPAEVARLAQPCAEHTESIPTSDMMGWRDDCPAGAQAQTRSSTQGHAADEDGVRDEGNVTRQMEVSASCEVTQDPKVTSQQMYAQATRPKPLRPGTVSIGEAAAEVADSQPPGDQLQRQPNAADLLSPVCMTGAPGACPMITSRQTSASNSNFSTNAMASSDGVAVAEVETTGAPETAQVSRGSGHQAMQTQWTSYAEQIPSQQSLPQHTPLYGVQGLPHHNLNNTSMTTSLPSGNWPVADSRGLHETMAPHFLPHNDVGGIHHDTVGNGYSINDEWMRTVEEMFTQYGDVTSYPS